MSNIQFKTCLVVSFWLGDRRFPIPNYRNDKLCLLKKQIEILQTYKNSLTKIIFNFNLEKDQHKFIDEIELLTPKKIQNAEVELIYRENYGMSYGAWSDAFKKYRYDYDFWVFDEDDYFFVQDDWDEYMREKFLSLQNCGYLCAVSRIAADWNSYRKFAGHPTGISSSKILNELFDKLGELPHSKTKDYKSNEDAQIRQTNEIFNLGYEIYDIREDFRVLFQSNSLEGFQIWRYFCWNEKELISPALTVFGYTYSWWEPHDEEFEIKK